MKMRSHIALSMLTSLLCAHVAFADFKYTAQTRSVSVQDGNEMHSAPDFSPFDSTSSITITWPNAGFANQHQSSILGPQSISIVGDFDGLAPTYAGTGYVSGESVTSVTFDVLEDTSVSFQAQWSRVPYYTVSIFGPGMNFYVNTPGLSSFSKSGVLTPGSYHLTVDMITQKFGGGPITSNFSALLTVPEPSSLVFASACATILARRRCRRG
jgi:hypothetical protein